MKNFCIALCLSVFICISFAFSYNLTQSDTQILDRAEDKIFKLIDDDKNIYTPDLFVELIYRALETRRLSDRQITLLELIAEDISWEYEIGDYASDSYKSMSASDCYEDEYYDEQDQKCYYEEDEDYDDDTEYQVGEFTGEHNEDSHTDIIATYSINGDIITLKSGEDSIKNQELWNIFTSLIPISARKDFARYEVVNDQESDTAAHVEQIPEDNTLWLMNVNLASFYIDGVLEPEESYATLIHEFAHVMTLNSSQVRYFPQDSSDDIIDRFAEKCETNFLQEWCLKETAYLDNFIDTFWSDAEYLKQVRNEQINAYEDTPESFVTDYAGTNPWEDIAESFTYFVLRARAEWNTIADQKLNFFYNHKELDSLRKNIRSNLAKLK